MAPVVVRTVQSRFSTNRKKNNKGFETQKSTVAEETHIEEKDTEKKDSETVEVESAWGNNTLKAKDEKGKYELVNMKDKDKDKEKDKEKKKPEDSDSKESHPKIAIERAIPMASIRRNPPLESSAAKTNLSRAVLFKDMLMQELSIYNSAKFFDKTPYRCVVLRAHYSYMYTMLLLVYFYAVSTYYGEEPIRCIDHYDRSSAPPEALDFCIQFPFTRKNSSPRTESSKMFATHYMWTHWLLLLLAVLYKIVGFACYQLEDKALKSFHKSLQDSYNYNDRFQRVQLYFQENYGNHRSLLWKVILLHFIAGAINTIAFFLVNIFLSFKYLLMPLFLLETRDFTNFDDPYSLLFPPFVDCEISPLIHIREGRTNYYGCHLPLMEIYEKVFMILWFSQVFLMIITIASLLSWLSLLCCKKLDAENLNGFQGTTKQLQRLPLNEVIVVNLVKPLLFGEHYRQFVCALIKWNPLHDQLCLPTAKYQIACPKVLEGDDSEIRDENLEEAAKSIMPMLESVVSSGSPEWFTAPTGFRMNSDTKVTKKTRSDKSEKDKVEKDKTDKDDW